MLETKEIVYKVFVRKVHILEHFVRTLQEKLGTVGTMSALVRTKAGSFTIENSIDLEKLVTLSKEEIKKKNIL